MRALLLLALVCVLGACSRPTADGEAARGLEHARAGRLEAAVGAFDAALRLDPDHLVARYNSGLARLLAGHAREAIEQLSAFVQLRPDDALGHFNLARAYALGGRNDEALQALRRAVELGFEDHSILVEGGGFQALYRDVRFVALEMLVAQRAGVAPDGGSLGKGGLPTYGGHAVEAWLPGTNPRQLSCGPAGS